MLHDHTRLALGLGSLALALTASGCAGIGDRADVAAAPEKPGPARTTAPSDGSPSPAGASTPSAEPTPSPDPTAAPSATAIRTASDRLLTAAELPTLAAGGSWEPGSTRKQEGKDPFGTCHRFAMTSIGATGVVVREYLPTARQSTTTAGHLVADFPDEVTARRAFAVLRSWHAQCEEALSEFEQHEVGDLRAVSVDGGEAGWYLLTYGPVPGGAADDGYVDAQGLVRVGKRVSLLRMRTTDADTAPDEEAVVEALRTASTKLA